MPSASTDQCKYSMSSNTTPLKNQLHYQTTTIIFHPTDWIEGWISLSSWGGSVVCSSPREMRLLHWKIILLCMYDDGCHLIILNTKKLSHSNSHHCWFRILKITTGHIGRPPGETTRNEEDLFTLATTTLPPPHDGVTNDDTQDIVRYRNAASHTPGDHLHQKSSSYL